MILNARDRVRRLVLLLAGATWAVACPQPGPNEHLQAWIFCDDCSLNERDSAAALGNSALPFLRGLLRTLPDDWRRNLETRYGSAARDIGLTGADSTAYVQRFIENFEAHALGRAALTLEDVGTPEAVAVLREALADSLARGYRDDVIRDLTRSLVRLTTPPVDGSYAGENLRFGDTVWITRSSGTPWDLDEDVTLGGAPFPDDVTVGYRNGNLELGFVAAAFSGDYAFLVRNVSTVPDSQHGAITIATFPGAVVTEHRDLSNATLPLSVMLALSRRTIPPDPSRTFRFATATDRAITARVETSGTASIALVWDACVVRSPISGQAGTVRGRVMVTSERPAPEARVTLAGTVLGTITNNSGEFVILNAPPDWRGRVRAQSIGFTAGEVTGWEGAAGITIFIGSALPQTSTLTEGPSGLSASVIIPGNDCRLLTVLRTDTMSTSAITRLSLTSP